MGELFTTSGEKEGNVVTPTPQLQGLFLPGIDNPQAINGFGIVTPWGGGSGTRRYNDYGISPSVSNQSTQLYDLASSLVPAEGGGVSYNFEGLIGPRGLPGKDGTTTILHEYTGLNSNYVAALPHNIDQMNQLGVAADKLIYTDSYSTTYLADIAWTERQPVGDANKNWRTAASDSDGSHLIAGEWSARLWTSADSGATWTQRQPAGDVNQFWRTVASDADGSHLIAGAYNERLWTSADSGGTWTQRQPAGDVNQGWNGVDSDSDGSHLIAGAFNGRLWTSVDSGASWTEKRPDGVNENKNWLCVASDSDGSHLIAGVSSGRLYTSANSGVDWTERQPAGAGDKLWRTVDSDSDGSHLIAGIYDGRLYTSANAGVDWDERQPAGNIDQFWVRVASDSDGSNLIVGTYTGRLYTSDDFGVTWTERRPGGDLDLVWQAVACDANGINYIAGAYGKRLYTGIGATYSEATWAEATITSAGRALMDDTTAAAMATTLGLGTGNSPVFTGLTLSGLTQGSVVFAGASGVISQDNSNLFWDDTINRLGVGVNSGFDSRIGLTISGDMDILHTAVDTDDHAFEIDLNAAGYGDVKAIDIVYVSGDIGAGEDEEAILVNVDESDSDGGGDIAALEVLTTDVGDATIFGLEVGISVIPIEQLSGTFGNMAKAENDGVNALTEFTTSDSGGANNIEIFVGNGDTVLIGNTAKFEEIEFILETFSNPSIKPTFEFSTGGTSFSSFTPADGTNGMRNNGVVLWLDSDIPSWATNTGGNYEIRITRTRANLAATPKEDLIQIGTATEYVWNKDGDVNINSLTTASGIELGHASDTTLTRVSAGVVAIEGTNIAMVGAAPSAHTVVSHSDTSGTGAELDTLTDGSNTGLHHHIVDRGDPSTSDFIGNKESGSATSTSANHLVDTTATFQTKNVVVGDYVKNTTDGTWAGVTAVNSETDLTLDTDIMVNTEVYYVGSFKTDGSIHELDLSSVVPAGAIMVKIIVALKSATVGNNIYLRKNGNSNTKNVSTVRTQVVNKYMDGDVLVFCDGDRKVEYAASNVDFTTLVLKVGGWFL